MHKIYINGRFLTQPTTGVQRYAIELVRQWDRWLAEGVIDRSQLQMEILCPQSARAMPLEAIPIRKVGRWSGHFWEQFELPYWVSDGLLFCPCNTAPVRCLVRGRGTVVTVHDVSYLRFPDAYSLSFRALYRVLTTVIARFAHAVLTDSDSERREILRYYPTVGHRLRVVRLGGAGPHFQSAPTAVPPDIHPRVPSRFVLYVGSMCKRKNVEGVLAAAAILKDRYPDVKLVVCGGFAKAFAAMSIDGDAPNVVMLGRVTDSELAWLYHEACCFVFPSFHEGSGLPPIEAMACGCPVAASGIPVHFEHLGDAALYCDPHDAHDIARKVAMILDNGQLAAELRRRGFKKAAEYSWERCAEETLRVMGEVLGTGDLISKRRRKAA